MQPTQPTPRNKGYLNPEFYKSRGIKIPLEQDYERDNGLLDLDPIGMVQIMPLPEDLRTIPRHAPHLDTSKGRAE